MDPRAFVTKTLVTNALDDAIDAGTQGLTQRNLPARAIDASVRK